MRDLALTLFVLAMLPVILWRPHIGALMWAWMGFMNIHRLAYGFAYNFPYAAIIAATTLVALPFRKERHPFPWGPIPLVLILFVGWMSFTSLFAMGSPAAVYLEWNQVVKIHLMLLVTLWVIRSRERIDQLVWVIVVSIGFYGVKGGIWTVLTGGGQRVWGPPGGLIEGNNELALALVMLLPFMYYLLTVSSRKIVRYGLFFAMVAVGFSILGSHSRGALLAIVAAAAMLALKSRHPILLGTIGAFALVAMIAFMPENWQTRMHTIETYEEDGSAVSRLHTWETIWNMAKDRPLVGAGFETELEEIYTRYAPSPVTTTAAPHSIYFQALGEHGFVGLALFLVLLFLTWLAASRIARRCRGVPDLQWAVQLARMCQVSLLGFMVGGAFLGLLHFDLPYYVMGLVVMVDATLKERAKSSPAATPAVGPGRPRMDFPPPHPVRAQQVRR